MITVICTVIVIGALAFFALEIGFAGKWNNWWR